MDFLEIGSPSQAVTPPFYFFMAKFAAKGCVQQGSHGPFISAKILGYTFIFCFHHDTLSSSLSPPFCVENSGAPAIMDPRICVQPFFS